MCNLMLKSILYKLKAFILWAPIYICLVYISLRILQRRSVAKETFSSSVFDYSSLQYGSNGIVKFSNGLDLECVLDYVNSERPSSAKLLATYDAARFASEVSRDLPVAVNLFDAHKPLYTDRATLFVVTVLTGDYWLERRLYLRRFISAFRTGMQMGDHIFWPEQTLYGKQKEPYGSQLVWVIVEDGKSELPDDSLHFINCSQIPYVYFASKPTIAGKPEVASKDAALQLIRKLAFTASENTVVFLDFRSLFATRLLADIAQWSTGDYQSRPPQLLVWPIEHIGAQGQSKPIAVSGRFVRWDDGNPNAGASDLSIPFGAFAIKTQFLSNARAGGQLEYISVGDDSKDEYGSFAFLKQLFPPFKYHQIQVLGSNENASLYYWKQTVTERELFFTCPGEQALDENNKILIEHVPWYEEKNETLRAMYKEMKLEKRPPWYTLVWKPWKPPVSNNIHSSSPSKASMNSKDKSDIKVAVHVNGKDKADNEVNVHINGEDKDDNEVIELMNSNGKADIDAKEATNEKDKLNRNIKESANERDEPNRNIKEHEKE